MNGVLVINKEQNYTSFDVVAVVRKTLNIKKIGHTGTLDPNATGVLPVLLGTATKAQDIMPNSDKAYLADFKFGESTDTLDIWGKVIDRSDKKVTLAQLDEILETFTGEIDQIPPMYSAVSIGGKRLYELARENITVDRKSRKVTVYSIKLYSFDEKTQSGRIEVKCSKGTYIRTLIDDIAKALGTLGVMTALQRNYACGYSISEAITLKDLKDSVDKGTVQNHMKSVESIFKTYEEIAVSDKQAVRFLNGNPLDLCRLNKTQVFEDKKIFRVKNREGEFLSLGIVDMANKMMKMYKHF